MREAGDLGTAVVVATVDSIDDISAVTQLNVSEYTSRRLDVGGAGGRVAGRRLLSSSSTVTFTIEVVLENTEFADSASIASNIESDVTSAVSSGNLTTVLNSEAAKVNVTELQNQNVDVETTLGSSTTTSTTVVVEYSRPPSPVPTGAPTMQPTLLCPIVPGDQPNHSHQLPQPARSDEPARFSSELKPAPCNTCQAVATRYRRRSS